jgi:hypothetical protein
METIVLFEMISNELKAAMDKYPSWPDDPLHALAVLSEEYGELAKGMLELTYEPHKTNKDQVRSEAIQVAAMSIRLILSIDQYNYQRSVQHIQIPPPPAITHGRA